MLLLVAAVGIDVLGSDLIADPAARLAPPYLVKASAEELGELLAALLALDAGLLGLVGRPQGTTRPEPVTTATASTRAPAAATTAATAARAAPAASQGASGSSNGNAVQTTRGAEL